jgi:hypothetical protein
MNADDLANYIEEHSISTAEQFRQRIIDIPEVDEQIVINVDDDADCEALLFRSE